MLIYQHATLILSTSTFHNLSKGVHAMHHTDMGVVFVDLLLLSDPLSLSNVLFLPPLVLLLTPPLTTLLPGLLHGFKFICCIPLAKLGHIASCYWLGRGKKPLLGQTTGIWEKREERRQKRK